MPIIDEHLQPLWMAIIFSPVMIGIIVAKLYPKKMFSKKFDHFLGKSFKAYLVKTYCQQKECGIAVDKIKIHLDIALRDWKEAHPESRSLKYFHIDHEINKLEARKKRNTS